VGTVLLLAITTFNKGRFCSLQWNVFTQFKNDNTSGSAIVSFSILKGDYIYFCIVCGVMLLPARLLLHAACSCRILIPRALLFLEPVGMVLSSSVFIAACGDGTPSGHSTPTSFGVFPPGEAIYCFVWILFFLLLSSGEATTTSFSIHLLREPS
jgi:hypothetical protein